MRFTTHEIDAALEMLSEERDGVPQPLGGEGPAGIGHDRTVLARRPALRPGTLLGTEIPRMPRPHDTSCVPIAVKHEDAPVCFGLWCAA